MVARKKEPKHTPRRSARRFSKTDSTIESFAALETIHNMCDRVLLLNKGERVVLDAPGRAIHEYRNIGMYDESEGVSVKAPSTTVSTAEAIGVAIDTALHAAYFGDGKVTPGGVAGP